MFETVFFTEFILTWSLFLPNPVLPFYKQNQDFAAHLDPYNMILYILLTLSMTQVLGHADQFSVSFVTWLEEILTIPVYWAVWTLAKDWLTSIWRS